MDGGDALRLGVEVAVDGVGDKGQDGGEQFERAQKGTVEGEAGALVARAVACVQASFDELQVVVGEGAPEEGLGLGAGVSVLVGVKGVGGGGNGAVQGGEQPAVGEV